MRHQIVSERTLLGNLAHEHRNRAAHGLIDINDEDFVVVAEEHGHPPLVGKTARTCTSITVLFTSERYPQGNEKQATCIAWVAFVSCDTWEHVSRIRFLDLLACML